MAIRHAKGQIQIGLGQTMRSPRVVVVTGAASGIGHAQMLAFLANGDKVIAIDKQVIQINGSHYEGQVIPFQLDLTQEKEIQSLLDYLIAHQIKVDILCNTAGQLDQYKPILDMDLDQWQTILTTNITSMFLLTKALLPNLIDQGASRIINMASIAGLTAGGGGIAYTTSKHAVVGFTKQMAYDYADQGVSVNAIAPGAIATPMNQADFEGDKSMARWVADQVPNKRWATPDEVAQLTLFLASDAASYIQGSVITMDGGWLIR